MNNMQIKLIDLNHDLIQKAKALGYDAICADYFLESYKTENPVLMTASNPRFTFGGGLDALFMEKFRGLCEYKQVKGGGQERIANIIFAITVDDT